MHIVGVDIGFSGAMAFLDESGGVLEVVDMPTLEVGAKVELDEGLIKTLLKRWKVEHAFLEKAGCMPKQGISSTSRYMTSYGIIRGICTGLDIPYTLVTPQSWKKALMQGMPKEKGASIVRVQQLYPRIELPRKKDHGQADAILIAHFGRQHLFT